MKLTTHFLSFFFFLLNPFFFLHANAATPPPAKKIAISQIVAHPSLDKVYQGIIEGLAQQGFKEGDDVHILFENAQGNPALAAQIAHQFVAEHPDILIAIATPPAQASALAIRNTTIPLVFASITDPVKAKLVSNLNHPGGMITGTRNVSPIEPTLKLIKTIQPEAKKIGVILNNGEENSADSLLLLQEAAHSAELTIIPASASTSADIAAATSTLASKVDALFLLQDNTVASALPSVLQIANKQKLPVYGVYQEVSAKGGLASIAPSEYDIGIQTGKMAAKILKGEKPGDLAVEDPKHNELAINLTTAKKLGITISNALIKKADKIYP